jgi:hypothetical protein
VAIAVEAVRTAAAVEALRTRNVALERGRPPSRQQARTMAEAALMQRLAHCGKTAYIWRAVLRVLLCW